MKPWMKTTGSVSALAILVGALLLPQPETAGQGQALRPIAVRNLEGKAGPGATAELRNALQRSNQFQLVPAPKGVHHVSGKIESGMLLATLESPDGRTLLKQRYRQEDMVQGVRQFADDIVLAVTRKPGIATSQIAYSLKPAAQPQVFLCDFDGDNVRQITRRGINVAPSLSGDGTLLAHVALKQGNLGNLILTDLTSGKSRALLKQPAHGIEAAVSPDGKRIIMSMSPDAGPPDLYVVKLSGLSKKPVRLLETPVAEHSPSWSPDGRRIVFSAAPGPGMPPQLYSIDVDARQPAPTPIATGFASASDPAWSPDGRRIAFVGNDRGRTRIGVHELGAANRSRPLADGRMPAWGADSRHLIYASGNSLSIIDTQTGKANVLVGGGALSGLSWTR